MTRRFRIRLTLVLVILGIPLILASLLVFSTATGRISALIAVEYARVMPGHLTIGGLRFTAADQVHLTDITIAEGLAKPLVRIASADARLDIFNGRLQALALHGVSIRLDAASFDLLQRIIEAGDKLAPSTPPQQWDLIADGDAQFVSGMHLTGLHCTGRIVGAQFEIAGGGYFEAGGKPFAARVSGKNQGTPTPGVPPNKRITVALDQAEGPLPEALAAVAAIGLLPPTPAGLLRWLPKHIDASGSVIHRDLGALHFLVPAKVRWSDAQGRPGGVDAQLDADASRIAVDIFQFMDPALGRFGAAEDPAKGKVNGTLAVDLTRNTLRFAAPRFVPGPGLDLPPTIPLEAVLRQVPRLAVDYRITDGATRLAFTAPEPSKATVGLTWSPGTPLRIDAAELPLTLLQSWMPNGLTVTGGQASSAAIVLTAEHGLRDTSLRDLTLVVDQGRATWSSWTAGPLNGTLTLSPQADGAWKIGAQLPMADIRALAASGSGSGRIEIKAIDALLARLHGPVEPPTITGELDVDLAWLTAAGQTTITVPKASLRRTDIRVVGNDARRDLPQDLLRQLQATVRGTVTIDQAGTITTRAGGQLAQGQLRLPGNWLDLAVRTPIFTIASEITRGKELRFLVRELLVRAADAGGTPLADGYSAQFSGALDEAGTGMLSGLVDHGDLGWVNRQIGLPTGAVDGEGAVTCEAAFVQGRVERLTGHFLPLNAEVQLGPRFRASGITGAVDFTLDRRALEEKP